VEEKLRALNDCRAALVHPAITFQDGKLTCQLQVGHPGEPGAVEGCFSTHLIDAVCGVMEHYNSVMPSRHNALCITKLQEARMWLEERARDRVVRGVSQTDKK